MAFPNLRNMINGYSRATITPIQEPPSFHYVRGRDRPPPPSDHPRTSSLPPPQSHRQPRPPSTKVVFKATWLHCEDCVRKTKEKMIDFVQGIQRLRIDTEKGVIEVEGSIDTHWLTSFLTRQFNRNVEVLTEDEQNGVIHDRNSKRKDKEGSNSVGDQEDTEETDKTPTYTSVEREQFHHPIKEQDSLGSINGNQQKFSDNVKADSDLQQPPTLPDVNLPNSINKNPKPEAKNSSSPQSPPTQPLNLDSYMVSHMREVVLKTQLHCEGCIEKLKRALLEIKGVELLKINVAEELIKVQGTMDTKELPACLMKKLNRKVEVVRLQPQPSSVNGIKYDETNK